LLEFDRRQVLHLATAATTAALGGCFGLGAADYPSYTDWIPPEGDGMVLAYVDFRITEESQEADQMLPLLLPSRRDTADSELVPDLPTLDAIDDPFLAWPLDVWRRLLAGMGIGLGGGLGYLVDSDRPSETIDELFIANDIVVSTGEFDTSRADERLRSGPDDPPGDIEHEVVGDHGEFTLYEATREGLDAVTAVSETAIVFGDTSDHVRTVIDTRRGTDDRAVDDSEPFGWSIETAGEGDFVAGWTGPIDLDRHTLGEPAVQLTGDLLSQREHLVASISFAPDDGEIAADLAIEDPELDGKTRDRIESRLGTSATEMSVSTEADRLSATATYPDDVLDLSFTEPQGTDTATDTEEPIPPEGDTPPEVANAVPDGALELSHDAAENHLTVTFERELAVDKVTLRASERDYRVWTNSPNETDDLTISVDPDGDVVIVTATVDGVSGEIARRKVP
jgi:hypothetical protein